jgi:hypothetical protein
MTDSAAAVFLLGVDVKVKLIDVGYHKARTQYRNRISTDGEVERQVAASVQEVNSNSHATCNVTVTHS